MSKQPIIEFVDQKQAEECLKEWQSILFLDDWIIKVNIVDQTEMTLNGCVAESHLEIIGKCCVINILRLTDDLKRRIVKVVHEKSLVHELLHCKYNWISSDGEYEAKYVDICEHALLDQMAKSLIMLKYGLPFSWFKNNYKSED